MPAHAPGPSVDALMTALSSKPVGAAPGTRGRSTRGRRYTVRALLATATVLAVLATFAVWANRQVLDADNWADTSAALLEDPAVQLQVSSFIVESLYANVDVAGELEGSLPPTLQPLAGPVAGGLRNLAQQTTERALARPRLQEAWRTANRLTAEQFIALAQGKSGAVSASGDAVILDLRVLVADLVTRLGLSPSLADRLPPDTGRLKILESDQVSLLQTGTSLLRGLALVLPVLSLGLFALAVYVARGRRRQTLLAAGLGLIAAGAVVLLARRMLGSYVVGSLATTEAVRPAASAVWAISTSILQDVAQAVVIGGIPLVGAALLAGPSRIATALRRHSAPFLREHPDLSYTAVGALVLLVIVWGPIPATQKVIPVLVMIAVVIVGVEALRRQTALEFPPGTNEPSAVVEA
jgi:hypothetical protein